MIPEVSKQFHDWVNRRVEKKYPRSSEPIRGKMAQLRANDVALEREAARRTLLDLWPVFYAFYEAKMNGGGITYAHEDDEIGAHACCHTISYKNHSEDCWVKAVEEAYAGLDARHGF
jgi:hypothetical protein